MAKAKSLVAREAGASSSSSRAADVAVRDEDVGLLAAGPDYADEYDDDDGLPTHSASYSRKGEEEEEGPSTAGAGRAGGEAEGPTAPALRTPRTPNRVRFDLTPTTITHFPTGNGAAP